MKMKDGRTHLTYKAEHTIDLESEFLLDATVYHGDEADTATLTESLSSAQENLKQADVYRDIEEAVADKGYHANQTLADCREWGLFGLRTYIPEPDSPYERRWTDKPPEHKEAVYANRRRMKGDRGKRLQKKRSELVERSFAHMCETGGARRTWLRGLEKVNKRYKMVAAARNLGLIMRKPVRHRQAALPAGRLFVCVSPPCCQNRYENRPVDSQPPGTNDTITQHKIPSIHNRNLKTTKTRDFSTGC